MRETVQCDVNVFQQAFHSSQVPITTKCNSPTMQYLLSHPKVCIRYPQVLERKLTKFIKDGADHLIVIADFDHTLSRSKSPTGEECCISYGIFEKNASNVSCDYAKFFEELKQKYLPIELDISMNNEEKAPHMLDWWQQSNNHILRANFTRTEIERLVTNSTLRLRCGADLMIRELSRLSIPLVIFSAGIGNVIEICLKQELGDVPENVHLISNMMHFDEQGIACGFSDPLIHTFCKNGSMIYKCPSLQGKTEDRYDVLLLGDSLGDLHMADGYGPSEGCVTMVKIGFLNRNVETNYQKFVESFDIVLVDDQTVDIPRHLLEMITASQASSEDFMTTECSEITKEASKIPSP